MPKFRPHSREKYFGEELASVKKGDKYDPSEDEEFEEEEEIGYRPHSRDKYYGEDYAAVEKGDEYDPDLEEDEEEEEEDPREAARMYEFLSKFRRGR